MPRPHPAPSTRKIRGQRSDDRGQKATTPGASLLTTGLCTPHAPKLQRLTCAGTRGQAPSLQDQAASAPLPARAPGRAPRASSDICPLWTSGSTWWSQRGGPTRPHSELGRETPPRPGYCPKRGGRAGRRQVEPEVQDQRSEVRDQRSDIGSPSPDDRPPTPPFRATVPASADDATSAARSKVGWPSRRAQMTDPVPSPPAPRRRRPVRPRHDSLPARGPDPPAVVCPLIPDLRGVEQSGSSSGS